MTRLPLRQRLPQQITDIRDVQINTCILLSNRTKCYGVKNGSRRAGTPWSCPSMLQEALVTEESDRSPNRCALMIRIRSRAVRFTTSTHCAALIGEPERTGYTDVWPLGTLPSITTVSSFPKDIRAVFTWTYQPTCAIISRKSR